MNNYCVITTINKPTKAVETLYEKFGERLIVIGDEKTPANLRYQKTCYAGKVLEVYAPFNSYARKNAGYMMAIAQKADSIYATDDDNIPN